MNNTQWHPRDKQTLPKGNWSIWLILAGRGFGKTRTGAENVMNLILSNKYKHIALIGESIKEAMQIMVEGISGLLSTATFQNYKDNSNCKKLPKQKPLHKINNNVYKIMKNKILFNNDVTIYVFGGNRPNSLRGYQFDLVWIDEFAKFKRPEDLWDQVMFSLRLGNAPKCIVTTTPKPLQILKQIADDPDTHLTTGSTFENADNLSKRFINVVQNNYKNTQLGRQELYGELILEKERPLWKRENIRYNKINMDLIDYVVIGVDPAVTNSKNSDETGIIVAGLGLDKKIYIINDLSGKYTGTEWAKKVVRASIDYKASYVVVETNNGGDLVIENLRSIDSNLPIRKVHAVKGKVSRAEPISILYETDRVFHFSHFNELEKQMCDLSYDDENCTKSPDRVDALVWAVSELRNIGYNSQQYKMTII